MQRLKIGILAAVAILAIVVVAQNTESVETQLLFVRIEMPRALLLLATFLAGVVVGLLLVTRLKRPSPPPTPDA